ncbi:phytoene desaturase family protein [Frigoribacterium sp. PhB24]|uniref:phytoene desaturase family protein n=1 Tax=Frigoribacterium sp. PhB24 TaxID=2485204 RepID=UPI003519E64C
MDVAVVGSGPNGLAAAVTLARAGLEVVVYERAARPGGACRSDELTLPGFVHDLGAAVHPLALHSPFFRAFGLADRVRFASPIAAYAHPLDGGRAGIGYNELDRTLEGLGADSSAYERIFSQLAPVADHVADITTHTTLGGREHLRAAVAIAAAVGKIALRRFRSRSDPAEAMLAGLAAHAIQPLPSPSASAVAVALGAYAHGRGWPIPIGGSQAIVDALVEDLTAHGGRIVCSQEIQSLAELGGVAAVLLDTSVPAALRIAGDEVPSRTRSSLRRFRFGPGVAKVDFALTEAVPWQHDDIRHAGTVHLGGCADEIRAGEHAVANGRHAASPYVMVSQPSLFDTTRAPAGHTLWAYAHVPNGSRQDQAENITAQIERFAPGLRDTIIATASTPADRMETWNPNLVGGDINAGATNISQIIGRPRLSRTPWRIAPNVYICSQAAAPGPGVHGMSGYRAAKQLVHDLRGGSHGREPDTAAQSR